LIELMIVLAVVGILAMVAYPSYMESVKRGQRSSARTSLLEAQQFMERFYAANRLLAVPAEAPRYNLSVVATLNAYTLTATPIGTDICGDLTLTHTGVKGRSASEPTVAECWR
jgi:type IV pilus assembly protein PilE